MHDLGDKILWASCCVMAPTMVLTSKNPRKWVRVLGVLGVIPLFPLLLVGAPGLLIGVGVMLFEEI